MKTVVLRQKPSQWLIGSFLILGLMLIFSSRGGFAGVVTAALSRPSPQTMPGNSSIEPPIAGVPSPPGSVNSAPSVNWDSVIIVQNKGSATAQIQLQFYQIPNGSLAKVTDVFTLQPGRALPVIISAFSDLTPGKYSVVILSTQPVAAVVNSHASNGSADSYSDPVGNTNSVNFPNVNRNLGPTQWNTPFYIQNADTAATNNLSIAFYRFSDGVLVTTLSGISLNPGASYEVDPVTVSGLSDNTQYSVVATASVRLAGAIMQYDAPVNNALATSGFNSGGTKAFLANLNRNLGTDQWNTPFIIQNIGASATDLTIEYYDFNTGTLAKPPVIVPGLLPGRSYVGYPHLESGLSDNTQYSAVVTSSSQPIVGVIQQHNNFNNVTKSLNHSAPNSGGTKVFLPNLNRKVGVEKWDTPFIIQNVGTSATDLTIEYYNFNTGTLVKTVNFPGLQPGRSYVGYPHLESGLVDGTGYSAVV
ncbi:MAG: hypothetical protein HY664_02175, partial [Chloroflexi bacterium]|nr:hypothetical protein [Chloroflexota bacterium]